MDCLSLGIFRRCNTNVHETEMLYPTSKHLHDSDTRLDFTYLNSKYIVVEQDKLNE